MCTDRREFLRLSAGLTWFGLAGPQFFQQEAPAPIRQLKKMTDGVVPISDEERKGRLENARRLMAENKIEAIYLEPGSSMFYFTGMRWSTSERMFALVVPARGELAWVCPKFEEERARELIKLGTDIRTWEEDESPYKVIAQIFKDRGIRTGRIGIDERLRFFIFDGVRKEASHLGYVSADPVIA